MCAKGDEKSRTFSTDERKNEESPEKVLYNLSLIADTTNVIKDIVSYPDIIYEMFFDELLEKVKGCFSGLPTRFFQCVTSTFCNALSCAR